MKQKIKIDSLRVKNYEFTGELNPFETPIDLLDALRVLPDQYETAQIEIFGEFGVSVSQDEAEVDEIYNITAYHNGISVDITDDSRIDTKYIVDEIMSQSDAGEWYQDKLDSIGDAQYEAWKDSQFDTE
jgi:hypothetical protein